MVFVMTLLLILSRIDMVKISIATSPSTHAAIGSSVMIVSLLKKLYLKRQDMENVVNKSRLRTLAALIKDENNGMLPEIELALDDEDDDEDDEDELPNELPLEPNAIT